MLSKLTEYYNDPHVRARFLEFMGGTTDGNVTAEYITANGHGSDVDYLPQKPNEIWSCLESNQEVGRSLWDRECLIVDFDIEYVNFDQPAKPFVQPQASYQLQQPVVETIQRWLNQFGIAPLHWISGQGHHFAWKIRRDSDAFHQLAWLGQLTSSLEGRYQQPSEPNGNVVGLEAGQAWAGLGMVIEFVAEEIKHLCEAETPIPVTLTAVEAGPTRLFEAPDREVIALDISEYGDPLDTRGVRMPFSVYLKPNQKRYQLGDSFVDAMPYMFPIPLFEMDTAAALAIMRNATEVVRLAERATVAIPCFSNEMLPVIEAYKSSALAKFHQSFYENQHDDPDAWPNTYDRTPLDSLPSCVRQPLEYPNDLLLKPAVIQHVVRTLMSQDWSPRHIAGLIRSKYERDYDWGSRWFCYDASSRADFYVRVFAGEIVTGRDQLVDFNCVSTKEKQFCPVEHCGNSLIPLRDSLLRRVSGHEDE